MTPSANKNDRFTLPYIEKMALRGTLRELLTGYTKTNGNRVLSIAIRFDKAEKKKCAKSTTIDGLSAPEECAVTFRAEFFPVKSLRDEKNADDKLAQMKKDPRNSSGTLLDRSFSTTISTYMSFPLYLPDEERFVFCGSSSDSMWLTITLFGEQAPSKPPRRLIDRDDDVYSMHSSGSRELSSEKYAVEMVEKTKSGVRLIERPFDYDDKVDYGDTKNFALEIGQHQQKIDSEEASKSDPTLRSAATSLISEIQQEEDVEEDVGKEVNTEGGHLDKEAFTQGGSVQVAAAGNGGVDGDDSRVVTLQVGFPMEK